MEELLKIINLLFVGDVLPNSFYMFEKLLSPSFLIINYHLYCKICLSYLKKVDYDSAHTNEEIICEVCSELTIVNLKHNSFFVTFDIEKQLRQQITRHNLIDEFRSDA